MHNIVKVMHQQHAGIQKVAKTLNAQVSGPLDAAAAEEAVAIIAVLNRHLVLHLAQEDFLLYPALQAQEETRILAHQFMADMGALGEAFDAYQKRWLLPAAVLADGAAFRVGTKEILNALEQRIEREEGMLFPLLKKPSQIAETKAQASA